MRLTPDQRRSIVRTVRDHLGADAAIWLYGSRTRGDSRGGDVDLLIQTARTIDITEQAKIQLRLERALSLPVDVSFIDPGHGMNRFQRLIAAHALPVEAPP